MSPRLRKFIGLVVICLYVPAYVVFALGLANRLPDNGAVKMAFYIVAGLGWGVPLFPLIRWMQTGRWFAPAKG